MTTKLRYCIGAEKGLEPIDPSWLKKHVDLLLDVARRLGPDTAMGKTCMLRADHIMDMVKAWKEYSEKNDGR